MLQKQFGKANKFYHVGDGKNNSQNPFLRYLELYLSIAPLMEERIVRFVVFHIYENNI